jgi:hypothetical protein
MHAALAMMLLHRRRRRQRSMRVAPPPYTYSATAWSLDDWDDTNALQKTRFTKHQLRVLVIALKIEATEWSHRIKPDATMALVVTLMRLSRPRHLADLCDAFGYSGSYLSRVINDVCQHLIEQHHERLQWHPRLRQYKHLRALARRVAATKPRCGGRIWGFIDGHFTPFSRPESNQHMFYSGHKKLHGMVFQAITTPDGLISSLFGPFVGRTNDWGMYNASRVPRRLHRMMPADGPRPMLYLYGDPAYHLSHGVMSPFGPRKQISSRKRRFNKTLSRHRISVEHSFGQIFNLFKSLSFQKGLRVGDQAVAAFFLVAALLCNCWTCLNEGNQTSMKYQLAPPTLAEYLGLGVNDLAGVM